MTHSLGCKCLACLLMRLRMLLRSEAPTQLHTHAAPVLRDFEGIPERETDEGGIGLPFTASFHRYLEHSDHWGLSRLGMLSIIAVSDWCAGAHPHHRRPLFQSTVCGQLVYEAGKLGQDVADLVWLHKKPTGGMPALSEVQITGMLATGLRKAEEWRVDTFSRWTKEPGVDEPLLERSVVIRANRSHAA